MHAINPVGVTCDEILNVPIMGSSRVLSGKDGLGRTVTRVNVMEVPDIIDWVRPGDFLVTTSYPFRDDPALLTALIPQLEERGVSALGIKTSRFVREVPEEALTLANKLNFPIFELPPETSFSDVVRQVMECILSREAKVLLDFENRIQSLTSRLLQQGDIDSVIQALEQELQNPVFIIDTSDQSSYTSSNEYKHLFNALTGGVKPTICDHDRARRACVSYCGQDFDVYTVYIPVHDDVPSILFLLGYNHPLNSLDCIIMDRLAPLIGLELRNAHARRLIEARYIDQFLADLQTGKLLNTSDIRTRALACGCKLDENSSYTVVIVEFDLIRPSISVLRGVALRLRNRGFLVTIVDHSLTLIIPEAISTEQEIQKCLTQVHSALSPDFKSFSFCVGTSAQTPVNIHESYRRAKRIQHVKEICSLTKQVLTYDDLGVYKILYLLPRNEEVERFTRALLEPLKVYDEHHDMCLIKTLNCFFYHGMNIQKAANDLFVHYNTVVYRLDKIRLLTHLDPRDADAQLQFQIALKLQYTLRD